MDAYYTEIDKRLKQLNMKPSDMERDFCPALVAEHEQLKAEWHIMDVAATMMELNYNGKELNHKLLCQKNGLEQRQKMIDLMVKLVLSIEKESRQ